MVKYAEELKGPVISFLWFLNKHFHNASKIGPDLGIPFTLLLCHCIKESLENVPLCSSPPFLLLATPLPT